MDHDKDHDKDHDNDSTHFGFSKILTSEKTGRVAEVFNSVAGKYDLMNDLMSLGTHRIMKQMTCDATRARTGHTILDLAGGTGDLALRLAELVGDAGHVCLCDINMSMLDKGRDKRHLDDRFVSKRPISDILERLYLNTLSTFGLLQHNLY